MLMYLRINKPWVVIIHYSKILPQLSCFLIQMGKYYLGKMWKKNGGQYSKNSSIYCITLKFHTCHHARIVVISTFTIVTPISRPETTLGEVTRPLWKSYKGVMSPKSITAPFLWLYFFIFCRNCNKIHNEVIKDQNI